MRLATVDIGTNSTKLLIADWDTKTRSITPVHENYVLSRLGEGSQRDFILKPAAMTRAISALRDFKKDTDIHGVSAPVYVAATMCTREAHNQKEFTDAVRMATGWTVHVLSGVEEARFSYRGARTQWPTLKAPVAALDIGGGSSEWIVDDEKGMRAVSLSLGGVKGTELFMPKQPPEPAHLENFRAHMRKMLTALDPAMKPKRLTGFMGIGGTVTSIAKMFRAVEPPSVLPACDLEDIIDELMRTAPAERLRKYPFLGAGRADIILAGVSILATIMEVFEIPDCLVTERGLRFGLLHALACGDITPTFPD
jgi:exopolyphosphatase/guanosine-5'-triphosphate,3'-diphosphate pyrophosphatase